MRRVFAVLLSIPFLVLPVRADYGSKYVALTFDDGPSGKYTRALLDGLYDRGAKATFLLCGYRIKDYPDITRRIFDEGHEIGLHGYSHKNMLNLSRRDIAQELMDTEALLPEGCHPAFFRPPGCEDVEEDMISYSSNIDIVADVKMPMNFKMYDLRYVDTIDVNISMTEIENEAENETEPGTDMVIFDELELKLIVENKLPIQITPLIYMVDDGVIIDSLFTGNSCIQGCFDGIPTENALIVKIVDEKIDNILSSDQLILDLRFSTEGNMSMMNINDYVKLRLGLKTKTTQISF